jgi:hypothetical protein
MSGLMYIANFAIIESNTADQFNSMAQIFRPNFLDIKFFREQKITYTPFPRQKLKATAI